VPLAKVLQKALHRRFSPPLRGAFEKMGQGRAGRGPRRYNRDYGSRPYDRDYGPRPYEDYDE